MSKPFLYFQDSFQYMIEASDGTSSEGGIFSFPTSHSLLSKPPATASPSLVVKPSSTKIGSWDENSENIGRHPPHLTNDVNIILSTGLQVMLYAVPSYAIYGLNNYDIFLRYIHNETLQKCTLPNKQLILATHC